MTGFGRRSVGVRRHSHAPFMVEVQTTGPDGKPLRQTVALCATLRAAHERWIEVLKTWGKMPELIRPGTRVSIIDLRDGGKTFWAEALGTEETTPLERMMQ